MLHACQRAWLRPALLTTRAATPVTWWCKLRASPYRKYHELLSYKLTRGLGLALYKLGSSDQEYFTCSHFEPFLSDIFALKFHFLRKNKLTCQYPRNRQGKYSSGAQIGHCSQALNIQNFDLLVVHTQQLHFLHAAE